MIVLNNFQEPDSVIRHQQINTKAVMDHRDLGVGVLYVTESVLSWQGPQGFSLDYSHISLHALSKDRNLYPTECLYLMIDKHVRLPGDPEPEPSNDDSDEEPENDISELIFEPEDKSSLPALYEAIKDCQELHPDPENEDEDEAFEDDYMEAVGDNVEAMEELNIGDHRNGFCQADPRQDMDEDQFEDAD